MRRYRTINSGRHRSLYALAQQPRPRGPRPKPPRAWTEGKRKMATEAKCRRCSRWNALHPHHIVPKSLGGDNDARNCCPLCFPCHREVHNKDFDLWPLLADTEKAHAVEQLGEARALELLRPSRSIRRVE